MLPIIQKAYIQTMLVKKQMSCSSHTFTLSTGHVTMVGYEKGRLLCKLIVADRLLVCAVKGNNEKGMEMFWLHPVILL
jgi:hypothetical protein